MNNNFNEDYQYDSCISKGICSVNPRTSSLQEILVLYLKQASFYALKLEEIGIKSEEIRSIILNTISVMVSNPEFSENDFIALTNHFNQKLPILIEKYTNSCKERNIVPEFLKTILNFNKQTDIIKSIQMGEKEFLKVVKSYSNDIRDLYKILFVLAKSICINILDSESFGIDDNEGYLTILKLLNTLNNKIPNKKELTKLIIETTIIDNKLNNILHNAQVQRYGKPQEVEVSYSTTQGKAILVVGSNIRELEDILESVKEEDIDVYTHDEMMLAHTFPFFLKYSNLKGQYGQGMQNCLLDFATFPGPIVLTRHSLYNVEHLYRGRLFTTDYGYLKGVVSVKNKDFSEVIKSANNSKGFKTGKQCETVSTGFDYEETSAKIKNKLESNNFSRIFIIAACGFTLEEQSYFSKLIKQAHNDTLIVSFSYCAEKENTLCFNACFDNFAPAYFAEQISKISSLPITVFFPKCGRHTLSQMIYLSQKENIKIYVGKCTPIILNPNLINTLHDIFNINGLTTVKKDLEKITE